MRRAIALLFVIAPGVDTKTIRVDSLSALYATAGGNGEALVILRGSDFHDGTIEADIAGTHEPECPKARADS